MINMSKKLMINDFVATSNGIEGRVNELYTDTLVMKDNDGEDYWLTPSTARPVMLTEEWIKEHNVLAIAEKNQIVLDFSRKYRLKVSLFSSDKTILITYYYPKPKYVHELQQILRYFNEIELV